jgi:hypothetical protein
MDTGGVREAMNRQPFLPFQLRLADGRAMPVPHPDFITISPNNRRVIVFTPPDDAMSILEPLLIVSVEYPGVSSAGHPGPESNGSPGA